MGKEKELNKFKRIKAIIDGTEKPTFNNQQQQQSSKFNNNNKRGNNNRKHQNKIVADDSDEDIELDDYSLPSNFNDEEIDEDDAFDDDDEITYGDYFNKKNKKNNQSKKKQQEEEEDDEDEELNFEEQKPIKDRRLPDVTEMFGSESQFNVQPTSNDGDGFDINDLLNILPEGLDIIRNEIGSIKDKKPISTPMSKFETEKLTRKMTMEQAKELLTQWAPFIKEMRQKNAFYDNKVPLQNSIGTLAKRFESSDINDQINSAIDQSGVFGQVNQAEIKKIDPIEEKNRLREIIKLRSIMFYKEMKDKRQKKIKSKKYHKILKKEKEKEMKQKEAELMALDPEYAKHKKEMAEEERIRERMTLKHKNQSKFMKNVLRGGLNKEARQQINDSKQLERNLDELADLDENTLTDKERIQLKLKKLGRPTNLPDKGINAMKFMQKSLEKDLDHALRQHQDDYDEQESEEKKHLEDSQNRVAIHKPVASNKTAGSKVMESGSLVDKVGFSAGHKVQISNPITVGNSKKVVETTKKINIEQEEEIVEQQQQDEEEVLENNPWLEVTAGNKKKSAKKEQKRKSNEFLISLKNLNHLSDDKKKKDQQQKDQQQQQQKEQQNKNDKKRKIEEINEEDGESNKKKSFGMSLITSNRQKELLLQAFAKDDVEDEFMKEKMQSIEEDVPEVKSNYIPGWGTWTGDAKSEKKAKNREEQLKIKRQENIKKAARKRIDYENSRVIIDEKAPVESVSKYVLTKLPNHYASKDQYESTLSLPVGKDWNTRTAFQKLIEPKVSVIPGTYIKPVSTKDKDFMVKAKQMKVETKKSTNLKARKQQRKPKL
eukprot:gene4930-6146_t